jgi:hypothetical protein
MLTPHPLARENRQQVAKYQFSLVFVAAIGEVDDVPLLSP